MTIEICRWAEDEPLEPIAEVLAESFVDYPVMVAAVGGSRDYRRGLVYQVGLLSALQRRKEASPILVARVDGAVGGVALVKRPDPAEAPDMDEKWEALAEQGGPHYRAFFDAFLEFVHSVPVPEPHLWLSMIGVHPEFQGQGLGRRLLDAVDTLVPEFGAKGVGLDTETATNVELYRRCGYEVVREGAVEELPVWVMFKTIQADRSDSATIGPKS